MKTRVLLVFAVAIGLVSAAGAETRAEAVPKEWVDPATGHRVVRLSELPGSVSFYFHQNAYTPEGDKLLISTPRGLETVDLATRELNVVVDRESLRLGGSSGLEMGRKTRQVYYTVRGDDGLVLRATNVDTRETRDLVRLPSGASFNSINADETLAFGSIRDFVPGQSRGSRSGPRQMRLFTANLVTGEITTFHESTDWLNHLQCSPTDPTFGLFCHEGSWHELDRVWTIRFGEEEAQLMHRREIPYEIAGHEFFGADGEWVWYDLQTPRASQFWIAGVNVKTGERRRYEVDRKEWSVHYNVSRDGTLFAGDGGGPESVANQTPLPEKRRLHPPGNGQWIYLFRPPEELVDATVSGEPAVSGTMTAERLVDLSSHDYDLEPNVTFTPDGKWVVFRSDMHGPRHVYAVSVEREELPQAEVEDRPRLVLIGDSTVKNGSGKGDGGLWGWGQVLAEHFDADRIDVENRALGGRSSRTYLTEGLWQKSLERLRPGDYVIMQFGHNDGGSMFAGERPRASIKGNGDEAVDGVVEQTGKAETVHSYGWYLRRYINDAKEAGATPIVVSPVPRDRWEDGKVLRADADYGLWAKQAAEQAGAVFLDLNELIARRYEGIGEAEVGEQLFTADDWTHTTRAGALVNAVVLVDGLRSVENCELADFLQEQN
jgi:lysophospholipase L1-like esterase